MKLNISEIVADSTLNTRSHLDGIPELAESIKANGQLQPVVVRAREDGRYDLISGYRRFAAVQSLDMQDISAEVTESSVNRTLLNLVENVSRDDIGDYDYAVGIQVLKGDGLSTKMISKHLAATNKARTSVSHLNNLTRLLETLHPAIVVEWARGHGAATVFNLLQIIAPVNKETPDHETQMGRWEALNSMGDESDESEDGETDTPEKTEKDERVKVRGAAKIAIMMEKIVASEKVDPEARKHVLAAFRWVMYDQKTLLGMSID